MKIVETLRRLMLSHGPSGFEEEVRGVIIEEIKDFVDELEVDGLGNLIAVMKGDSNGPKIMIDAHMDEVSLIVKHVDSAGWVYFETPTPFGGIHQWTLLGQHMTILTRKGPVNGVIGAKGRHFLRSEDLRKIPLMENMWIDVGAESEEEAKGLGIRVGDPITFFKRFETVGGDFFCGTSLDNRIGCTVLIEVLKQLKENRPEASVYAVGSVMEEVGLRGARTAAYSINPDIALVVDTTYGQDPVTRETETRLRIGQGPVIRAMERGHLVPPKIFDLMISIADAEGIPYQLDTTIAGTNASSIHLIRGGIPTGSILVARRYSHSPVELGSLSDVKNAVWLFVTTVNQINKKFVSGLRWKVK